MIDYREYENGVTDVLRFIAGSGVKVERDVLVPVRRSGAERQVDVLVRGSMFGLPDATLAVDCKMWKKKLDVTDVGAFLTYLDDVGADLGMLITTEGYTPAAKKLAQDARGVRAEVLTLRELEQWSPKGTIHVSYRIPADRAGDARAALVRAGLAGPAIELECPMTGAEGSGSVLFGGVDEFLAHAASRVGRKRVKQVDRDAQGRGAGDRGCEERDWSGEVAMLGAEPFRSAFVGIVVVGGKLVGRPGMG